MASVDNPTNSFIYIFHSNLVTDTGITMIETLWVCTKVLHTSHKGVTMLEHSSSHMIPIGSTMLLSMPIIHCAL